jgi:hypothetical protein
MYRPQFPGDAGIGILIAGWCAKMVIQPDKIKRGADPSHACYDVKPARKQRDPIK